MKICYLTFLFLLASIVNSFALHPPSTSTMHSLETQLTAIKTLQGTEDESDPLKRTGILGLAQNIRLEKRSIEPNNTKLSMWEQQLDALKAQQAAKCQKLIEETRAAYGIEPHRWSDELVLKGEFNKTRANWSPKFGEWSETRTASNRFGDQILMMYPGPYVALTWENGDIVITIDAFAFSPGYLAAIIKHETVHFDQITTLGRGDKMSPAGRENEAFHAMQGVNSRIFNLTPSEMARIQSNYESAIKHSSSQQGSPFGASGFDSINLTENPDGEELLRQKIKEAMESAARNRERLELERQRDIDARLKSTIIDLAKRTCAEPGSVTQAELDALPSKRNQDSSNYPTGVSHCELIIFIAISTGENADSLQRRAAPGKAVPIQGETPTPMQPARGYPPSRAIPNEAGVPLSTVLQELKRQAGLACQHQGRIGVAGDLFNPRVRYFQEPRNEQTAAAIKAGLGPCEGHVFQRFFEMLRDERGSEITEQWLVDTVSSAPTGASQGGGSNPCEMNGDPFGCQPRR